MFTLLLERAHRVLLSRFSGTFTLDDIAQCDRAVMLILGREGPVRGIIDLSDVDIIDLTDDQLAGRAQQPAMAAGQARIFVAKKPAALAFAQSYVVMQRDFGSIGPQTVATLAEAFALLRMMEPN